MLTPSAQRKYNLTMAEKTLEKKLKALLREAFAKGPLLRKIAPLLSRVEEPQYSNWNEKSIEYYFARRILDEDTVANPLAGDAETLFGDLIIGIANGSSPNFCAIEFKARKSDINSEYDKYLRTMSGFGVSRKIIVNGSYSSAEMVAFPTWFSTENPELVEFTGSKSHFIIFGQQPDGSAFELCYGKYAEQDYKKLSNLSDLLFCDAINLTVYLKALALARFQGPPPGDGGVEIVSEARGRIAANIKELLVFSDKGNCATANELLSIFEQWSNESEEGRTKKNRGGRS